MKSQQLLRLIILPLWYFLIVSLSVAEEIKNLTDVSKNKTEIKSEFEKCGRDITLLEQFIGKYPFHNMPIEFQKEIEDRFIDILMAGGGGRRFRIADFEEVARKDISAHEHGSVTVFGTGTPGVIGFHLEYPKDRQPFGAGGAYLPTGHGSVWRFKGRVEDIMGFTFEGDEKDPLRFLLFEGHGLVYLYGKGKVYLKSGTIVSLPCTDCFKKEIKEIRERISQPTRLPDKVTDKVLALIKEQYVEEVDFADLFKKTINTYKTISTGEMKISELHPDTLDIACRSNAIAVKLSEIESDNFVINFEKVNDSIQGCIDINYTERFKDELFISGLIVRSLDQNSDVLSLREYEEATGKYYTSLEGIGLQLAIKNNVLTVISPLQEGPAWNAGISPGDIILKIDGEPTSGMSLRKAVTKTRGEKGTKVMLAIMRDGWKEAKDFTITRNSIKIKSIRSEVLEKDIGYVKIIQFKEGTAKELADQLKDLSGRGIKSIVLDLRNNPGGLLSAAVDVAGQFLRNGSHVVYIKDRGVKETEFKTHSNEPIYNLPIVVLVNQGTAGAAEIVAGALKDWKRANIVGTKTFGKGTIQSIIPLSDGSVLRLTTAKYYTPNDWLIQDNGIVPDVSIADAQEKESGMENKQQLDYAIRLVKKITLGDGQQSEK